MTQAKTIARQQQGRQLHPLPMEGATQLYECVWPEGGAVNYTHYQWKE